jgi:hypothetical protein
MSTVGEHCRHVVNQIGKADRHLRQETKKFPNKIAQVRETKNGILFACVMIS